MSGPREALRLEGVGKVYEREASRVTAVHDVSFTLAEGEYVALLGASGSGKSTLLALMGLMDTPTTGRVLHSGRDLAAADEKERERERLHRLGFVFQHYYLLPTLTAEENIAIPMKAAGVPREERERRLQRLLAAVGLEERRAHLPHELSGGEQQRVAVARALANNPTLLLADEPTGELDREAGARVLALLDWAHRELGCAVVLVTHQEETVPPHARRLRLDAGRLR